MCSCALKFELSYLVEANNAISGDVCQAARCNKPQRHVGAFVINTVCKTEHWCTQTQHASRLIAVETRQNRLQNLGSFIVFFSCDSRGSSCPPMDTA